MKPIFEIAKAAAASVQLPETPRKIPPPALPIDTGPLAPVDQWKSILWHINTAEAAGREALFALAMAFGKAIQSTKLHDLLTDAREIPRSALDLDTLLWEASTPITENGDTLESLRSCIRAQESVSFQNAIVVANPWVPFRLMRSLATIGQQEWRQDHNHQAEVWTPWPILWVTSGNHSVTAATILGKGLLRNVPCFDSTPVLAAVETNGINWIRSFDQTIIEPVHSIEMAAIFEIGRRLTRG